MVKKYREIEVKLRLDSVDKVTWQLKKAGAKDLGLVEQLDILFDYTDKKRTFGTYDQVLRLRIEKSGARKRAYLEFKDTPQIDASGKKCRDEFSTIVDNLETMEKILTNIGFKQALRIKKKRHNFCLDGVEVAVDEAKFGCFLELEGEKKKIDDLMQKLDLAKYPVERVPYYQVQLEWEKSRSKKLALKKTVC